MDNLRSFGPWFVLTLALLAFRAVEIGVAPSAICHDGGLELQCAQLLADGKLPYLDFFEINPPLIIYLNVIPVALARWGLLPVIPVFSVLVLALAAWSIFKVRALLRRGNATASGDLLTLVYALIALFVVSGNFGQREHLFMLMYFPWFLLRARRFDGEKIARGEGIALGIVAAVGVCIKPQFLIVAIAGELYWLLRERRGRELLRAETVAFALTGLAYAGHFFLLPAAFQESLFGRWIPFIARGYPVYNSAWPVLLKNPLAVGTLLIGVAGLVTREQRRWAGLRLRRPLAVLVLAGGVLYLMQHKGWSYHTIPMLFGAGMLQGVMLVESRLWAMEGWRRAGFGLALAAVLLCGAHAVWRREARPDPIEAETTRIVLAESKPGDAVLLLATSVPPAHPLLLQLGRRPGSRYLWHFPIGMFYRGTVAAEGQPFPYRTLGTAAAEERRYLRELAEDLATIRPELIVVSDEPHNQGCPAGFCLWDYLQESGFAAEYLDGYHELAPRGLLHTLKRGDGLQFFQ